MAQFAKQRLFHTADKKALVPEGHEDAAFLFANEGDEIPASACELYGLKDGAIAPAKKETAAEKKVREEAEKSAQAEAEKKVREEAEKSAQAEAEKKELEPAANKQLGASENKAG